jgi:hypothetical protein
MLPPSILDALIDPLETTGAEILIVLSRSANHKYEVSSPTLNPFAVVYQ